MSRAMLRPLSRPLCSSAQGAVRPTALRRIPRTTVAAQRAASSVPQKPLQMPPDMPREDYATPAMYTVSFIGRVIKYVFIGTFGLGVSAFLAFEGAHMYVEKIALAAPSRAADDDTYAWADENQAWTGGEHGGTDPRLGWRARHALRGAWICWEWGAGEGASAIARSPAAMRHPEIPRRGMIGAAAGVNRVDRGYELAEEYIEAAIKAAEAKGFVFPPAQSLKRDAGPPREAPASGSPATRYDNTVLDLLTLKAGILERIGTPDSIEYARELYERVLTANPHDMASQNPVQKARAMRLAHKIGDLAKRAGDGDGAQQWWAWGLQRAGLALPGKGAEAPSAPKSSSWWPFGGSSDRSVPTASPATSEHSLAPPVLRAGVSILVSASAADAHLGTLAGLNDAAAVQQEGLSLLPAHKPVYIPGPGEGAAGLQTAWEEQRRALLTLHAASVAHARNDKSMKPREMATEAAEWSEAILAVLNPILPVALTHPRSNPCAQPAKRLVRDTLTTGAEAYFTAAALLERTATEVEKKDKSDALHRLEHAGESYERAMSLAAAEEGQTPAQGFGDEDAIGRSEEWTRYWRGYVRVRDKMLKLVGDGAEPKKHA